jgi:hypothetical protein
MFRDIDILERELHSAKYANIAEKLGQVILK